MSFLLVNAKEINEKYNKENEVTRPVQSKKQRKNKSAKNSKSSESTEVKTTNDNEGKDKQQQSARQKGERDPEKKKSDLQSKKYKSQAAPNPPTEPQKVGKLQIKFSNMKNYSNNKKFYNYLYNQIFYIRFMISGKSSAFSGCLIGWNKAGHLRYYRCH